MADTPQFDMPEFVPGTVWLVGAGPGDPGLLTLLAHNALRQADVIIYDALVNPDILKLARQDATLLFAGKRGGRPSVSQPDISSRLVDLAKAGFRVLRLKGGDPFVFGRGGEEALSLAQNAIPYRIVPGISAGIGGLAYAGIPVTFRTINSAVTFLTGHDSDGGVPSGLDWPSIAKASPVIVIYMALRQLDVISAHLMAAGRPGGEPVALVSKATTAQQQVVITDLRHCAARALEAALQPPTMMVVGPVALLHEQLNWMGAVAPG
ncbi:MAG TPA: uroporphyrinogen-III C-methyltransferase [Alphaproteobacteria bacterium]|nr:uroporphyrinogen-III C-methyltransferase [Alphaproteobacteria bacterium]